MKLCHTNFRGINVVGEVFSTTIFSFYLDKLTNSAHILSIVNVLKSDDQKTWKLFLKIFNVFRKSKDNIEKIEIFISEELSLFLGGFQIPSEILNYRSDEDLTEYDKNSLMLDMRCGLIPCSFPSHSKENTIDFVAKCKTQYIKPQFISIYTNIPLSDRVSEKIINGDVYQLLHQIPLKRFHKNSPNSIEYFPKNILYKNLSQNSKMDMIEVLLLNSETGELINLIDNFIVNLCFKQLKR